MVSEFFCDAGQISSSFLHFLHSHSCQNLSANLHHNFLQTVINRFEVQTVSISSLIIHNNSKCLQGYYRFFFTIVTASLFLQKSEHR